MINQSLKFTANNTFELISLILNLCRSLVAPQRRKVHLIYSGVDVQTNQNKIAEIDIFPSCDHSKTLFLLQCLSACRLSCPIIFVQANG